MTNKLKCRLRSESNVSNLYIGETNQDSRFCLNDQANSLIHFYKRCVSLVIWRWLITKGPNGHHGTKELFPSENTISSVLWRKKFQGITISFVCQTVILPCPPPPHTKLYQPNHTKSPVSNSSEVSLQYQSMETITQESEVLYSWYFAWWEAFWGILRECRVWNCPTSIEAVSKNQKKLNIAFL